MTGPAVPTTASLRILINKILLSDSDLDAFCLDFFREDVHKKFTSGLDRTQKENILLGCVEAVSYTHLDVYKRQS